MMKKTLVLLCFAVLVAGCAKRQTVKPGSETGMGTTPSAEGQQQPGAGAQGEVTEPSVRSGEFTTVPQLETIYFNYDASDLSAEARAVLKKNADYLTANPGLTVLVEGHADERGTTEYNLALGQRRAAAVRDYYGNLGIDKARVATISYGEEQPAVQGTGEEVWAKNRRAVTKVK